MLDKLKAYAKKYGTESVVQTAIGMGFSLKQLRELVLFCMDLERGYATRKQYCLSELKEVFLYTTVLEIKKWLKTGLREALNVSESALDG